MSQAKKHLRMALEHAFQFSCGPNVPCFTSCCQDVNIVLTPYDVVRMKNALNISSGEFIDKHTVVVPKNEQLIPMVLLKMDDDTKRCQLVSDEKGCTIYDDRPWPCRMFPLDLNDDGTFSLIAGEDRCKGLCEKQTLQIGDWLISQGVPVYDEMNALFAQITIPLQAQKPDVNNPQISQMLFMSLYNLDKFREFVFKSSFLKKFAVAPEIIKKIENDDVELLKFSFDWIKFGILGEKTMGVQPGADKK